MGISHEEFFEISAVSQLTGVSPHVLRVWERRYEVVSPDRSHSRRRKYSQDDIRRLTLLKGLVDAGHSIGTIARLPTNQLEERYSKVLESTESESEEPWKECRIAFVGGLIREPLYEVARSMPSLKVVGEFSGFKDMTENLKEGTADLIACEKETLFLDDVIELKGLLSLLKARRVIVIYHFAHEEALKAMDAEEITPLKAPVGAAEFHLACLAVTGAPARKPQSSKGRNGKSRMDSRRVSDEEIPDRKFSDEDLIKLGEVSSVINCECPRHIANLLSSLVAFEEYSSRCEDRNEEDAVLHAFLHKTTADCRALMEHALEEVIEQEGIEF